MTQFTWHEESPTEGFWKTTYPGVLNKCEMCHLPGTYDFSASATVAAYPNMLASTVGQGTYAAGSVHAPYVTEATAYGAGFSYNAQTGATVNADPTTLVVSPIVAACSACHDSPIAIDHMQTNGGSFYEARSMAFTQAAAGGVPALPRPGPDRVASPTGTRSSPDSGCLARLLLRDREGGQDHEHVDSDDPRRRSSCRRPSPPGLPPA